MMNSLPCPRWQETGGVRARPRASTCWRPRSQVSQQPAQQEEQQAEYVELSELLKHGVQNGAVAPTPLSRRQRLRPS